MTFPRLFGNIFYLTDSAISLICEDVGIEERSGKLPLAAACSQRKDLRVLLTAECWWSSGFVVMGQFFPLESAVRVPGAAAVVSDSYRKQLYAMRNGHVSGPFFIGRGRARVGLGQKDEELSNKCCGTQVFWELLLRSLHTGTTTPYMGSHRVLRCHLLLFVFNL